jgi:hypothetical protein
MSSPYYIQLTDKETGISLQLIADTLPQAKIRATRAMKHYIAEGQNMYAKIYKDRIACCYGDYKQAVCSKFSIHENWTELITII